jgi:hypothetical protein
MEATVLREAIARQTVQDRLIIERNAEGVRSLASRCQLKRSESPLSLQAGNIRNGA